MREANEYLPGTDDDELSRPGLQHKVVDVVEVKR
jgi:hypothetical protein